MRHILLIINVIGILWYNMPQDISSSRLNKNISFNLQTYNQEIHEQIKQLPDSIVKNIQWQYLDSF